MPLLRRTIRMRVARLLSPAVVALTAAMWMVASAPPAAAHGSGGNDTADYRSEIRRSPHACLAWSMLGGDARVQLENRCQETVTVLGYEGEPYLRFSAAGIEENQRSPARWLNQDRYAQGAVPPEADADAEPEWQTVSDGSTLSWHDHRVHWMAPSRPSSVSPGGGEQRVFDWSVPYRLGTSEEASALEGTLWWTPPPSWWPPLAGALTGWALLIGACAALARLRSRRWWALSRRPLAVVVLVFTAAVLTHGVDDLVSVDAGAGTVVLAAISLAAAIAGLAVAGARTWRDDAAAYGALLLAGLAALLFVGAPNQGVLGAPYLFTSLPGWFSRGVAAVGLTLWVPAVVVAVASERHHRNLFGRMRVPAPAVEV